MQFAKPVENRCILPPVPRPGGGGRAPPPPPPDLRDAVERGLESRQYASPFQSRPAKLAFDLDVWHGELSRLVSSGSGWGERE